MHLAKLSKNKKSFKEHNAKNVTVPPDFMKAQSFKKIFTVKMYS